MFYQIKSMLGAGLIGLLGIVGFSSLSPSTARAEFQIVTSFPQDAAIAKAIGGDRVAVKSLSRANQDPHNLQPKPSLAVWLNRADLLIVNGQDMELAWLPIALTNARNGKIIEGADGYFNPSEGVSLIPYSPKELEQTPFFTLNIIAGASSAGGGQITVTRGNHHFWLDPANGLVVARNIAMKLSEMEPDHAVFYQENLEKFRTRLTKKIEEWDAIMVPFKGTKIVTYHRDWIYLLKRHGLDNFAYIEPRETIPPSAAQIASLVKKMKRADIRLILTSSWQRQQIPKEIAKQTGAGHIVLPTSVGKDVGVKDYIDLFDVIYGRLSAALKGIS
ncbi:MAG: metal ABC transporter substrate-binding protein [Nitrospiria bacterium]